MDTRFPLRAGGGAVRVFAIPAVAGLAAAAIFGSASAGRSLQESPAVLTSGEPLWSASYPAPRGGTGRFLVVTATGRLFVTNAGFATLAYDGTTGRQLWLARYTGPGQGADYIRAIALSSDQKRVFVTGTSYGGKATGKDYATVAYDTTTGTKLWAARYNGPRSGYDAANALAVGPAGKTVFVTGQSSGERPGSYYATLAYDAKTGKRLWVAHKKMIQGSGALDSNDAALAVSPDGGRVFMGGVSPVAYRTATGKLVWVGRSAVHVGSIRSLSVSHDGARLFTTGQDYATSAYSAATGKRLWVSRYGGNVAGSLVLSANGRSLFATGLSHEDYATVAYGTTTGRKRWVARYKGSWIYDTASGSVALSKDGKSLFLAASTSAPDSDYATIAYNPATGARRWAVRHDEDAAEDLASALAVSDDGTKLFVTGSSSPEPAKTSSVTIAYDLPSIGRRFRMSTPFRAAANVLGDAARWPSRSG